MKAPPGRDLQHLDPVALEEITAVADLRDRFDTKYIVASDEVPALVDELERRHGPARVLEIDGRVFHACCSNYFDTPALDLFRAQVQGRRRRYKVRTRRHDGADLAMFEVKLKDGTGRTRKHRVAHAGSDTELGPAARHELAGHLATQFGVSAPRELMHAATVTFERATLLLAGADNERVTLDRHIEMTVDGRHLRLDARSIVVEVKSTRPRAQATAALGALGHRPVAVSKYALALTAVHPDVRGNAWLGVMRRLTT